MKIGIDLGASTTDIVYFDNKIIKHESFESKDININEILSKFPKESITITGGKSKSLNYKSIDEIQAIGLGAKFLTKKERCLVISLGTGTCIVNVNKEITHIGGTGVGGGTLIGLSKLLANIDNINDFNKYANGNTKEIDISVEDIIGDGIGIIPADLTASNFGKADKNHKTEDKLTAIANLVGETCAMLAIMASKATNQNTIILTGKLTQVPIIMEIMKKVGKIYNKQFIIPKNAEIATAIGAALC